MQLAKVIAIALILALALIVSSVSAGGNGIDLNGQHYNLNLIAGKIKNWDETQSSNSHVIFVGSPSGKGTINTRIYLREAPEGETFDVIDGNGADGVAQFQLPKPYTEGVDVNLTSSECRSEYQIYVRVVAGKGSGTMRTGACADLNDDSFCTDVDGNVWYHSENVTLSKSTKFQQVTHELTTVQIGDQNYHYGLFSDAAASIYGVDVYFWELMGTNLKTIQLRFYETPDNYCTDGYPGP